MTENYSGLKNAYILIGKETTYGTPVTCTKDIGINAEANFGGANEIVTSRGMSSRGLTQIQIGNWRFRGDVTCEFQNGRLLEYALGSVTHSGTADPYTHTFSEADDLPSFTAEVGLDGTTDDVETYAGCKINSLTLALDLGGKLTMRAEVLAKTVSTSTTASAAIVDDLPTYTWAHATFKTGASGAETAVAQCRAFEWTITNNLSPIDKFGSYLPEGYLEENRDYSVRVTLAFTDANERSRFLAGTTGATAPAETDFEGFSAVLEVARSASRKITITMSDCYYTDYSRPISVGGLIVQDFTLVPRSCTIVTLDDIDSTTW